MKKNHLTLVFILFLSSCVIQQPNRTEQDDLILERSRVEYDLAKVDQLLVSNSPTSRKDLIQKDKEGVTLNMAWIIRNTSSGPVQLNLRNSSLVINEEKIKFSCLSNGKDEELTSLAQQTKIVISCKCKVIPNAQNKLLKKDTDAQVYLSINGSDKKIGNPVLLRIEDFER